MGIILALIAGFFTSFSNFCMRKSIDSGGTSKAFLMVQLAFATLFAILIGPIRTNDFAINGGVVAVGLGAGLVLGFMFLTLGRALEQGPPGLTFAVLNASTVMPAIVMVLAFGATFGYIYTPWQALGSVLVLLGLFWAGRGLGGLNNLRGWLLFATLAFTCHLLFLVVMQWRALILNWPHPEEVGSLWNNAEMASQWFMPCIYFAAALLQTITYLFSERRMPHKSECGYGIVGGIANSLSTFFLIWATEVSNSVENIVIFPIFSVSVIIICNFWGQRLYQERVNWKACQVCTAGLFVATVDWKALWSLLFGN